MLNMSREFHSMNGISTSQLDSSLMALDSSIQKSMYTRKKSDAGNIQVKKKTNSKPKPKKKPKRKITTEIFEGDIGMGCSDFS